VDKNGYNPTILQDKEEFFVSHETSNLVRHEVFYGTANRKLSKEYGLWVWLKPSWHNMSNNGVHFNKELDLSLKRYAQKKFEEKYSRDEFIKIFGKNYL